ncbi:hypothetical protein B8W67_11630 [Mycolicibacillus koreensis]|uniref:PE-PPE domain-containing protein n=1 Tax=Mycolicibacillus koreensis TaxID=1069220 RepID=A0AA91SRA6_9MYCO|nr:hypothetical protein B8W67_11630 [Mycolicibacillus koreensis]
MGATFYGARFQEVAVTASPLAARPRSLGALAAAALIVAVLGVLPPVTTGWLTRLFTEVALLSDDEVGWIMGGTGFALPGQDYVDLINQNYFGGAGFLGLSTPEQFCPIVCSPPLSDGLTPTFPGIDDPSSLLPFPQNLTFGSSVATGAGILNHAIEYSLNAGDLNAGDTVNIFGYSQSAVISTVVMQHLQDLGIPGDDLNFVLVGSPNNPIGGLLTRLQFPAGVEAFNPFASAPQHLPFLNVPLSIGPTPTDFADTDIYTAAYDGWANFPEDPTNLPAVLNAIIGILTEHPKYPELAADTALNLGSIDQTTFYMFQTDELPLLWPIYQLGDFGKVIGHALQPGLELGINWGYGNPGDLAASANGLVGPWAVNASGELAKGSGLAGFIPMMDPLQMFAGAQDAGIHTFLDPLNDILGFAGLGQVPDWLSDAMHIPYDLTNALDGFLLSGWSDLVGWLQNTLADIGINGLDLINLIGPDAIFNGLPLISGAPVIDAVGLIFDVFNFFGA